MKMIIKSKLWALIFMVTTLVSCSNDEGIPSVVQKFEQFKIDATTVTTLGSVTESGNNTITFDIGDSKQITGMVIAVNVASSSTAVEGEDFTLSTHSIVIPAYAEETLSVVVTIIPDTDNTEGDETIVLELVGANKVQGLLPIEVEVLTIRDSTYTPTLSLEWAGELVAFPGNFWESFLDIDLLIFDGAGNEVTGFAAATGAQPEQLSGAQIPNGTFTIEANLYFNPIAGNPPLAGEFIPVVLRIFDPHGDPNGFSFSASGIGIANAWIGTTVSDPVGTNNMTMGTVTVSNGGVNVTLTDANGTVVATF